MSGLSLVQRSSTECGVSECDREVSIMRRPTPTRTVEPTYICLTTRPEGKRGNGGIVSYILNFVTITFLS